MSDNAERIEALRLWMNGRRNAAKAVDVTGAAWQNAVSAGSRGGMMLLMNTHSTRPISIFQRLFEDVAALLLEFIRGR